MKNVLALLAAVAMAIPAPSYAIVGGPFDNNTPTGLYGGTYEAIYKFKNGNGIVRFSQSDGFLNLYSFSLIFYKGIIYQGNAAGSVNPKEGYATGMSSGTTTGVENANGQQFTFFTSGSARNIGICNTNWFGRTEENGYHVRFSGKGVAHFFGQLDQTVYSDQNIAATTGQYFDGFQFLVDDATNSSLTGNNTTNIAGSSVGLPIVIEDADGNAIGTVNLSSTYAGQVLDNETRTTANRVDLDGVAFNQTRTGGANNVATAGNGGESTHFDSVGHRVKIKVYGSKVSYGVPGATGETYTPLHPLTGDTNAPIEIGAGNLPGTVDISDDLNQIQIIEP